MPEWVEHASSEQYVSYSALEMMAACQNLPRQVAQTCFASPHKSMLLSPYKSMLHGTEQGLTASLYTGVGKPLQLS